jgi:hypothetical protein
MVSWLLLGSVPWLALISAWCLIGATHRGQQGTSALMLIHIRYGLSTQLLAVFCMFRRPSICRQVHRELTRNELRDLTTIVHANVCRQKNYVGTYSRYICSQPINYPQPAGRRDPVIQATACTANLQVFYREKSGNAGPGSVCLESLFGRRTCGHAWCTPHGTLGRRSNTEGSSSNRAVL